MAVAKEQIRQIISENNINSVADIYVSASKEGVVLFPPPIDILGKTNIF